MSSPAPTRSSSVSSRRGSSPTPCTCASSTTPPLCGLSASAGGPNTEPLARRSCCRSSPITMRGRVHRPLSPSLLRAARWPGERWSGRRCPMPPSFPPCLVLAMADLDDALAIYDDALTEAHRRGSIITFATTKAVRAQAYVLRGDLAEAEAEGREAFAAAEAWGATSRASVYLAAILAEALMEQGKLGEAGAALKRSALGESLPDDARLLFLPNIRARLRMLNGDLVGGLEDMLDTGRHSDALGGRNPAFMAWRSQAALALLQLGDRDEARRLAAEELELARTWGAPRALGAALR